MAIVSTRRLSQLEGQKRIDAEYYEPEYSEIRHRLSQLETKRLKDLSTSVVSFGAYSLCNYIVWREEGVPYLNVENIREGYIDLEGVKYIDEDVNEILRKSQVKEDQVILTMAGTIGNAAVAYKLPRQVNSNQATAKITLRPNVSPFFIAAFLNSYFGKKQTEWEIVTSVQPNIFLWQIENLRVPIVSTELEKIVEETYKQGLDELELSKSLYSQAESLLLEELELKDFQPKYELSYSASLSKAFGVHRIDAEYFQLTYDALESHLVNKFNAVPIGKIKFIKVTTGQYCEEYVGKSEGMPYIRGVDITNGTIRMNDLVYIASKNQDESKKAREGDVIVTRVGTIGLSARIPKECAGGTISDNLIRLRFEEYKLNSYYLALFLGSPIGVSLMIRNSRGSVQQRLNQETLKEVIVPILPFGTQLEIASLVEQSHEARQKARGLLEEAKRKVEEAVEAASA